MILTISGRLQTVTLKAEPAKEKAKVPGAVKGSWGKAVPKAKTEAANGDKIILSEGSTGFEIPVTNRMFIVDPI